MRVTIGLARYTLKPFRPATIMTETTIRMIIRAIIAALLSLAILQSEVASAHSSQTLRSSVSPEFPQGLHYKYLRYIAEQMDLELEIYPMPFARRLASLKKGDIDIMVGLKHTHKQRQFTFLQPSYESIKAAYFVRANDAARMQSETDLAFLIAGFSIDEKEFIERARSQFRDVVTVTNLEQKIKLLARSRIDTFAHFESSAIYKIREMGMQDKLKLAEYQPAEDLNYHIGLSLRSPLMLRRDQFESVIQQGLANGDFAKMRLDHEENIKAN